MHARTLALAAALVSALPTVSPALDWWTLEVKLDGRAVQGAPLKWSEQEVHLLGRDGRLWEFSPSAAHEPRRVSDTFASLSTVETRDQLRREFGQACEVTGTGHYLVVHPVGQGEYWSQRFEDLYRSFITYFSVRGLEPTPPKFPLVAVVFANQDEFQRHAAADGQRVGPGVLGYYSPVTNRVLLYDVGGGREQKKNWYLNASTIVHEATHQTAFNTGVHSRFGLPPRWVGEGLGTLFEASAVWNGDATATPKDRVNRGRLADFQQYVKSRRPNGSLVEFIMSDDIFRRDVPAAYAEAWALSYYLSETQGGKYAKYLARTAARPPFEPYPADERLKDFRAISGDNLRLFEAKFLRFMEEVK